MTKNKNHQAAYRQRMAEKGFKPYTIYMRKEENEKVLKILSEMRDPASANFIPTIQKPRIATVAERINPKSPYYDPALAVQFAVYGTDPLTYTGSLPVLRGCPINYGPRQDDTGMWWNFGSPEYLKITGQA